MRKRRNNDWDDLPPMFVAGSPEPEIVAGPPEPGIRIPLDFPFSQADDVQRALHALEGTAGVVHGCFGDAILLRDMEAATRLHTAVRALVTNPAVDMRTRAGALRIIERIEAATGLSPNQGLVSQQTYDLVAHAPTTALVSSKYAALVRTPTSEDSGRVKQVMDSFPDVFRSAYARLWQQYDLLGVEEQILSSGGEASGNVTRHMWAMSEALWIFAELLGKAGVDARVIERNAFELPDYVIWFHDPSDPYLLEIELAPELFWNMDTGDLVSSGSIPALVRDASFFLNQIDKGEEDEWLDTFEEGIQENPGDDDLLAQVRVLRGAPHDMGLWERLLRDAERRGLVTVVDGRRGWLGSAVTVVSVSKDPERPDLLLIRDVASPSGHAYIDPLAALDLGVVFVGKPDRGGPPLAP